MNDEQLREYLEWAECVVDGWTDNERRAMFMYLLEQERMAFHQVLSADTTPPLTGEAHFCNQAGPMGGGCKDSWHVGGNYGSHVCRNPAHHDKKGSEA